MCWCHSGTSLWEEPTMMWLDLRPLPWGGPHEWHYSVDQEPGTTKARALGANKYYCSVKGCSNKVTLTAFCSAIIRGAFSHRKWGHFFFNPRLGNVQRVKNLVTLSPEECLYQSLPLSVQGTPRRGSGKIVKARRDERHQVFLDTTRLIHIWVHTNHGSKHRAFTGQCTWGPSAERWGDNIPYP